MPTARQEAPLTLPDCSLSPRERAGVRAGYAHGQAGGLAHPACLLPLPLGEGRGEGRIRPRPRQEAPRTLSPAARGHGKTRPRPDKRPHHPHPLPEGEGAGGGTTTRGGPTGLGKHWIPAFAGMTALAILAPGASAAARPLDSCFRRNDDALMTTLSLLRLPGASAAARPLDSCFRRNDNALMTTLSLPRLPGTSPTARPPGFLLSQE